MHKASNPIINGRIKFFITRHVNSKINLSQFQLNPNLFRNGGRTSFVCHCYDILNSLNCFEFFNIMVTEHCRSSSIRTNITLSALSLACYTYYIIFKFANDSFLKSWVSKLLTFWYSWNDWTLFSKAELNAAISRCILFLLGLSRNVDTGLEK